MKIVIAPDSYKESLSALEVATAIEMGFREIWPDADYVKLPVADGGEGTVEAMVAATQGHLVHVDVTGLWATRFGHFTVYLVMSVRRLSKWLPPVGWSKFPWGYAIR